ncbi:hypothetical protein KVR01_009954 [Diaporthe batatas]|uniref:uncharacterized protein n=1 Tax=Diaporthe batatas TaxID=748121 RepID=UPI001D04530C|nr:uncharacterized protein KVR01_009954 [Diaporthe batatas]KAG8160418.1 hypothetical protein KVR01_009954 [Diaporthe batatas]
MAPIRLAIIGLSSSAVTSWASSAHLPYLLSARGRTKYDIVALCNSSVESAKQAINTYGLNVEKTRAYGDPKALAADPDVDLVVCCTRVDTHYDLIKPSIEAGKAVFVEWPLTHDAARSRELAELAAEKGTLTMVGLQGRLAPVVLKLKEILHGGSLGRMLSSEVRAHGGTIDREMVAEGLGYFAEKKIGGNIFMIGFAHMFDYIQSVVGEATGTHAQLQLQRPEMKLRDNSMNTITKTVISDVPDLITVTGSLSGSEVTQEGATLLVRFRRGQQFKGEPALTWHINCEKGEIRLTSPGGTSIHAGSYTDPVTIEVHNFDADEVRNIQWEWPKWQEELSLPIVGRSVAKLYDAFHAEAVEGGPRTYPNFSDAVERHEQLAKLLASWSSA